MDFRGCFAFFFWFRLRMFNKHQPELAFRERYHHCRCCIANISVREHPDGRRTLTSLQRPLGDFVAKRAQTRPVVSGHLDLIVGPDDEVLQKQVSHVWTGDVLELVVHRQPSQTVPNKPDINQVIFTGRVASVRLQCCRPPARGRQSTSKAAAPTVAAKHLLFHLDVMNRKPDRNPN